MSKLAVVIGASRGIGLGLATRLVEEGYRVIGTCRKVPEALSGDDLKFKVVPDIDVAEDSCVEKLREAFKDETQIDLLIHNAGVGEPDWGVEKVADVDLKLAAHQMNINCFGAARVMTALGDKLAKGSKVLLVSSRVGSIEDNGSGCHHGYRMSKTALNMLGKNLSKEFEPKGVIVTLVHPGLVSTDMTHFDPNGISVETSVDGFMKRINELSDKHQGSFLHVVTGEVLPW